MKFIPELAGLRGIAATMVFVAHASEDGFLPRFIGNTFGKMGLMGFFILSGYLIAQVYLYKPFTTETSRSYLIARFARIAPVYFLVILMSFIISNYIFEGFHYDFTYKLKLLLSFTFINCPNEPWTIPVEVQFYFCFLVFWCLFAFKKLNSFTFFLLPLGLLIPTIVYAVLVNKIPHVMTSFSLFFFIGVFISGLQNKEYFEKIKNKTPSFVSILMLILFSVAYPVMKKKLGIPGFGWYDPISIMIVVFLFILVISKPSDFKILKLNPLIFMSEISYGFYLIHRPLMKITKEEFGTGLLAMFILFSVSVIIAWLSFKLIEVPARKFIESRFNSRSKQIKA